MDRDLAPSQLRQFKQISVEGRLVGFLDDIGIWHCGSPDGSYIVAEPTSPPLIFGTEQGARVAALGIFFRRIDAKNRLACK